MAQPNVFISKIVQVISSFYPLLMQESQKTDPDAQPAPPAAETSDVLEKTTIPENTEPERGSKRAQTKPTTAPNDTSLLREIALIKKATKVLASQQPQKTLQILRQYDKSFPNGVMRQEHNGLRVLALCDLGRKDEADREQRRFLAQSPNSPMAVRIQRQCGGLAPKRGSAQ